MAVPVRMWLSHEATMRMLVMVVMRMAVLVVQPSVLVHVLMALRKVQPQTDPHQCACDRKSRCQRLT
jgi:hypothetical protein